jgi:hypothetical protein
MSLNTGDGNDTAKLLQVLGGQFFIFMGNGDDTLDLTAISTTTTLNANGGEGLDRLTTFLLGSIGSTNFTNWEAINGVTPSPLSFDLQVIPGVKINP